MVFLQLLILILSLSIQILAWSRETHLKVQNLSKNDIITTIITDVDSYDFEKRNGPQDVFQNFTIPSGSSKNKRIEVNQLARNCPFTMTLWFSDLTADWFRLNQKYAIGEAKPEFRKSGTRDIQMKKTGNVIIVTVKDETNQNTNHSLLQTENKLKSKE